MSRKTSALGYYARGVASSVGGLTGMKTRGARFGVVNNLDHLQDEMTQASASLCAPASTAKTPYWTQANKTPAVPAATFTRFDFLPASFTFLRLQKDGSSSRLVVAVRAYADTAAHTVTARVWIRPAVINGTLPTSSPPPPSDTPETADLSFASTAATKEATIYVPRMTDLWLQRLPSTDGDGHATQVSFYAGMVEVWAYADAGSIARCESIAVREWVG